mmetsp:Transcript_67559/g.93968  ORF Transcript_67559/g.93968 Transcript_67559/m.93968 type:complete len:85 (-) Transcript_67559:67-321(-)
MASRSGANGFHPVLCNMCPIAKEECMTRDQCLAQLLRCTGLISSLDGASTCQRRTSDTFQIVLRMKKAFGSLHGQEVRKQEQDH